MRNALFVFALIGILSLSFAQSFSNPIPVSGTLDLTFVDTNGNPIPGATVKYTYVVSGTATTPDIPTTGTGVTDTNGHFSATITADARQTIPFKLNLTYQGSQVLYDESSSWLTYADKPAIVNVPIGALSIEVKDQKGRPIAGVPLEISGDGAVKNAVTNEQGIYALAGGSLAAQYTVTARYGDSAVSEETTAPSQLSLTLPAYDIIVRSIDDKGRQLIAGLTVNITSLGRKVAGSGEIVLTQVPKGEIVISARYGKASVQKSVIITSDATHNIILDMNAPEITSVATVPEQPVEADVEVRAAIDDGKDGIGIASAVLLYSVDGKDEEAVAMVLEGSFFSAKIPRQPAGSAVSYHVVATDRSGNKVESDQQSYAVKPGSQPDSNGSGTQTAGGSDLTGLIIPAIAAIAVIAIVAFIFLKRRRPPVSPMMAPPMQA